MVQDSPRYVLFLPRWCTFIGTDTYVSVCVSLRTRSRVAVEALFFFFDSKFLVVMNCSFYTSHWITYKHFGSQRRACAYTLIGKCRSINFDCRHKPVFELHVLGRIALRDRPFGHRWMPLPGAEPVWNVRTTGLRDWRLHLRVEMRIRAEQLQQEIQRQSSVRWTLWWASCVIYYLPMHNIVFLFYCIKRKNGMFITPNLYLKLDLLVQLRRDEKKSAKNFITQLFSWTVCFETNYLEFCSSYPLPFSYLFQSQHNKTRKHYETCVYIMNYRI